jgi:hypothetical protein
MSENLTTLLKSKIIRINSGFHTTIIGEPINSTGRKAVLEALHPLSKNPLSKNPLSKNPLSTPNRNVPFLTK